MDRELYSSILDENYLSDTKSRRLIFSVLHELHRPVTLPELVKLTANEIDKTTVYRVIDVFVKVGIVKKVSISWKESVELSDLFKKHHHHLICTNCKTIIQFVESTELADELNRIGQKHNFKAVSHNIEFSGYCSTCVKAGNFR